MATPPRGERFSFAENIFIMTTQSTPIAFSGQIPGNYDRYLGPMFFEPFALATADRISSLAPKSILELAAGTGRLTRLLPAVAGKQARILASDLNPAMVDFGRERVQDTSVDWHVIDAVNLPLDDASFDCVAAQFGVMFYSDRPQAFREAQRVLRKDGTFLFSAWDAIEYNPMAELANQTLRHFFPVDTPAFYSVPFSYFDQAAIRRDLEQAGFSDIRIETLRLTGTSASPKHAAQGLIEGTPTVTAIQDRDAAVLPELLSHLESKISERFGDKYLQVPLQALLVTARKG